MSDIKNNISVASTIVPAAYTATTTGTGVDLAGYDAAAVVIVTGAVTSGDFSVEVQESDALASGYTAVANADLDGTEPATIAASAVTEIGYLGRKRYIRVVATDTAAADAVFGVHVVRANPRKRPV